MNRWVLIIVVAFMCGCGQKQSSFEECMVQEMRGQPREMMGTVTDLCRKRFGVVFELYNSPEMTWLRGEKGVSIGVEEPTDYVAVSGKFLFTDKDCKEALNTDWSGPVDVFEAPFLNAPYTMLAFPPPEKVTHPVCMRTMSLKVRYKKPL